MSAEQIISEWKKGSFRPVYWLEGDEPFYIDNVINYAEKSILSESEAEFNLTVFYGKDADWTAVVNACRRYPMFADRQVVLLKEAQHFRDINHLEDYIKNPTPSTLFIIAYKGKKLDTRTKFAKTVKANGSILTTKKLYDNELPQWISSTAQARGYKITAKAVSLLADFIGNDLSRINNEISKIAINLPKGKESIDDSAIEQFVGISKDFNIFELQKAIAVKDLNKAMRIIDYFKSNPKAAPMQLVLPVLYNFFSKSIQVFEARTTDLSALSQYIGTGTFFVKEYMTAANNYKYAGLEKILLLLHQYNLRSIGIKDSGNEDAELLREMVIKIML